MRLERLEISGFKSFSERAELAFDQGVTAIVGPNGCGKSNVADAITWVLGEQSARSLRGERMEDVIFNGSDARRPGGAAEVRLRLKGLPRPPSAGMVVATAARSNGRADTNGHGHGHGNGHHPGAPGDLGFDEGAPLIVRDVEVTRRLYRSGESEYLIDGEVCRLRDVHELLMDTGLGAKAYAIIEQGKIGTILSSRPTDRRQLIEEAAGITKYKSRRRAAELKLEAAQQNLTRIDDIVFEVEKQRGTLKRQAARARRYQGLRDELRRWEKVLFARRYRELARHLDAARLRLADARARETAAAARLSEVETHLGRLRIELAEADARAAGIREDAHARDLDISRRQQQQQFNRQQVEALQRRTAEMTDEVRDLEARREPARIALSARRQAAADAEGARDEAAAVMTATAEDHARAHRQIEGLEAEVEAARADVFSMHNQATTLRHVLQHAAAQMERVGETLGRLDVEDADVRREAGKVDADRQSAADALAAAQAALDRIRTDRASREADLAAARHEHDGRTRDVRSREQELAAVEARLASLEELAVSRAEFGDAARMVLVQANGRVGQQGAVADYLDVDSRYERAVEACLGELLQHIIVERHEQAAAGLSLVREHDAGRCGFVVIDPGSNGFHPRTSRCARRASSRSPMRCRLAGPMQATIRSVVPEAYVADTFEQAVAFARQTTAPIATLEGDLVRGPHLVSGGAKAEARGILATRREIKELRERLTADRDALATAVEAVQRLDAVMAEAATAIAALHADQHIQEKAIVGYEAQLARGAEEALRLARKADQVALERRRADEERASLEDRRHEAGQALARIAETQREADARLAEAQQRLSAARETVAALGARAAEARASHAGLVERASALGAEVVRLEEGARELEQRIVSRQAELDATQARRVARSSASARST
jgi:chromosome segregation protein